MKVIYVKAQDVDKYIAMFDALSLQCGSDMAVFRLLKIGKTTHHRIKKGEITYKTANKILEAYRKSTPKECRELTLFKEGDILHYNGFPFLVKSDVFLEGVNRDVADSKAI